jgi:cytoskeletal protein CcmA (bactofilin family)
MDVQEAVAESTHVASTEENGDAKRDGSRKFTMGPNDSLEGKLVYDGSVHVDGHAEGEFKITGNLDVAQGATARISIEAANVNVKGQVDGAVNVRDKLTLGKNARLNGDIVVRRLQIEDGASLNGHVRMGDIEQHGSGG